MWYILKWLVNEWVVICATRKAFLWFIYKKNKTFHAVASYMTGLEWELIKCVSHVIPWCMKCILNYWFVDKMGRVNVILIHVWNVERPQSAFIHILIRNMQILLYLRSDVHKANKEEQMFTSFRKLEKQVLC